MPLTGVFFVPSNPNSLTALATITERLRSAFPHEQLLPTGRWAAEHKLMRDTPSCVPASANASAAQRPLKPRYLQFLSLSHYPNHGFIYTSEPAENQSPSSAQRHPIPTAGQTTSVAAVQPAQALGHVATAPVPSAAQNTNTNLPSPGHSDMIMTTVPLSSCATLFNHFVYACQPFWCHRHTVTVPAGFVYDVGDFRVRLGDVRQTQPTARVRGTVVEIEWKGPSLVSSIIAQRANGTASTDGHGTTIGIGGDDDADSGIDLNLPFLPSDIEDADVDADYAATAALIREFWDRLGISGAREAILVSDLGKEVKAQLQTLKRASKDKDKYRKAVNHTPRHDVDIWDLSGKREDADPEAGVDLARQFMEIFRFNR
ncbi:hypothetical protein MPDQ_008152 [Monascus purpureus]|uniref:Mediator of RNA polymerase II transcription subunit 20 n=1 Tax=Monascus purpureus TaxID=5098 RepID=A0A507QUL0_MONPU|nr:hypothetical protein MPDQ_008152 [Monascus purpureus]